MRKKYIALLVAMGIFLGGGIVGKAAPPALIPGDMFEGDYLRIGINNGGTLGITDRTRTIPTDPGVGFQWAGDAPWAPIAYVNSTESLAIGFWGEGYNIAYQEHENNTWVDNVAYWQPNFSYPPPPETNITLVSNRTIIDDEHKAVKEIVVRTKDNELLITFTFAFLKQYPELSLETTIMNNGTKPLRDVVYKRIADWDVCTRQFNIWVSTSHEAFAWGPCIALKNNPIQLSVEGNKGVFRNGELGIWVDDPVEIIIPIFDTPLPIVNYVDLYAWDDQHIRSPNSLVQTFVPQLMNGNAAIYYKIGELKPGESRTVYTVYQSNFPKVLPAQSPPTSTVDTLAIEETQGPFEQNRQ